MTVRRLTIGLAILAILVAAGAAYASRDWMVLVMALPVALIVLVNSGARPQA